MENKYDDIINLPHYEPKHHPRMSRYNRAAQFAPFAALTGYDDAVKETGIITNNKVELDEELINEIISTKPEIEVIYFFKDLKKSGGSYKQYKGNIRRIDFENRVLKFTDNNVIKIDDIFKIKCLDIK